MTRIVLFLLVLVLAVGPVLATTTTSSVGFCWTVSTIAAMNRLGEGSLNRPTERSKSTAERWSSYAEFCCPVTQIFRDAFVSNQVTTPLISLLFSRRNPATVPFAIWPVVVASVQSGSWKWWVPHIPIESFKRVPPVLGYTYSSSAIMDVCLVVWIVTSGNHTSPDVIDGCACHSVSPVSGTNHTSTVTAATFRMVVPQVPLRDNYALTAFTDAVPSPIYGSLPANAGSRLSKNKKPTESLACKIKCILAASSLSYYNTLRHGQLQFSCSCLEPVGATTSIGSLYSVSPWGICQ